MSQCKTLHGLKQKAKNRICQAQVTSQCHVCHKYADLKANLSLMARREMQISYLPAEIRQTQLWVCACQL